MLKKSYLILMLFFILFIFPGCKEFFTFNLFEGLDPAPGMPTVEDLAEKEPAEGVEDIEESFASDSFMDVLEEDTEAQGTIRDYLEGIYDDTAEDTEIRVSAAVLAADLELGVSGGDEMVNNIFDAFIALKDLDSGTNTGGTDIEAVTAILEDIVPDSMTNEEAFTTAIKGILAAGVVYKTLGENIITDPEADNASGDITGGVVFNAAICGILDSVVTSLLAPGYQTPDVAAGVLWEIYEKGTTGGDVTTVEGINPAGDFGSVTDLVYLQNISIAAGVNLEELLGSTEPVAP